MRPRRGSPTSTRQRPPPRLAGPVSRGTFGHRHSSRIGQDAPGQTERPSRPPHAAAGTHHDGRPTVRRHRYIRKYLFFLMLRAVFGPPLSARRPRALLSVSLKPEVLAGTERAQMPRLRNMAAGIILRGDRPSL